MNNSKNKTYFAIIIGVILSGVFIPTIVFDTNNRLITIPAGIGLVLIGWGIGTLNQK
jgi:hypothetical protein